MDEKIINWIKKMFALANCDGAAKGEAENAMRMANKLMEKYALSSIDLHARDDFSVTFVDSQRNVWARTLYNAVSPVYSCSMFMLGKDKYVLVGTESDMVTAGIVIDGLIKNIKRASKGQGVEFANGAAQEISRQCKEIIAQRKIKTDKAPGTELVLADVFDAKANKLQAFMDEKFNLTTSKGRGMNGNSAGRDYGAGLNPHANLSNRRALN